MKELLKEITQSLTGNELLNTDEFSKLFAEINVKLPSDYVEFMKEKNGGEGFVGANSYVMFWPFEELNDVNKMYMVEKFAPDLFLVGSDGGDTAYGIQKTHGTFIEVPFIGMANEMAVERGKDFTSLLVYLSEL